MFFRKTLLVIGLAAGLALGQEPSWVDRQEYELVVEQIGKATDPAKKLELLNQWKQKYPKTAFGMQRLGQFLVTYQQLGGRGSQEFYRSVLRGTVDHLHADH